MRVVVTSLCSADGGQREPRGRAHSTSLGADGLARLERVPLGLVDPALLDEHLGEAALRLAERAAILDRPQDANCITQQTLGLLGVPAAGRNPRERSRDAGARHQSDPASA